MIVSLDALAKGEDGRQTPPSKYVFIISIDYHVSYRNDMSFDSNVDMIFAMLQDKYGKIEEQGKKKSLFFEVRGFIELLDLRDLAVDG